MFGTIRRHQTWLWAVIITITIFTFVVWFSPDSRWTHGNRQAGGIGVIDGRPITQLQYSQAHAEVRLLYFLNFQKWPEKDPRASQMGFDVENESLTRLVRLAKAREEKIAVSDEAVGMLARRILGPNMNLDAFAREFLLPNGLTPDDFERFLRNDAAIQQLGGAAGVAGKLVTPREAEVAYREQHEELAVDAVFFSVSNYLANVTVSNALVQAWYSNNMYMFRIPERVTVSYVEFGRSNFLAEVDGDLAKITNYAKIAEEYYDKQGTNTFKDDNGKLLGREAALAKIKQDDRDKRAMSLAFRKASLFANELYDKQHTLAAFEAAVTNQGLKPQITLPFDETDGPTNLNVAAGLASAAFKLTKDEPISFKPVLGENGCYVFALKDRIPSQDPPYTAIEAKVNAEYRHFQALNLMRQSGMAFYMLLTNGLAQGKTFSALALEANQKVTSLPPLSRSTESLPETLPLKLNPRQLINYAFSLQPRKASSYVPAPPDGGFILYVRDRLPLDETKMKSDLPAFAASLRQARQNEAFGLWFRKVMERYQSLPFRKGKAGEGVPMDS